MRKLFSTVLVLGVFQMGWTQDLPPTIEGEGVATIEAQPERVEFTLKFHLTGESFEEAAQKAAPLEDSLTEALENFDPPASAVTFGAIRIRSLSPSAVDVSAIIRFPIRRLADAAECTAAFAKLFDRMNKLARQLSATVEEPTLGVDNPEGFEQEAVQRATENAFFRADAVAAIIKSQIYAVRSVKILDVEWVRSAEDPATAPDLDRLVCAASVQVVYALAPR